MKLQVAFTVDVEFTGAPEVYSSDKEDIEASVIEAITEAISDAENRGFNHQLENQISITFDGYVSANFQDEQPDVRGCLEEIAEWLDDGMINGVHYDEQSIADSIQEALMKLPKQEPVEGEFEVD